jgi:hypothetical protein
VGRSGLLIRCGGRYYDHPGGRWGAEGSKGEGAGGFWERLGEEGGRMSDSRGFGFGSL